MTAQKQQNFAMVIAPVLLCFFTMGFVALIGTASNYVKDDFPLAYSQSAFLTSTMLFLMFLVFSVPSALLMNKIGRSASGRGLPGGLLF